MKKKIGDFTFEQQQNLDLENNNEDKTTAREEEIQEVIKNEQVSAMEHNFLRMVENTDKGIFSEVTEKDEELDKIMDLVLNDDAKQGEKKGGRQYFKPGDMLGPGFIAEMQKKYKSENATIKYDFNIFVLKVSYNAIKKGYDYSHKWVKDILRAIKDGKRYGE